MYDEKNIRLMKPNEHIRLRPGMYIGGVDERALHHLIYEVVDNSIDEAMAGRCDHIWITLRADNEVCIRDNGPGLPVEINKTLGITTLEIAMTAHYGACGMSRLDSKQYRISGGMHGVGLAVVNALSAELKVETAYDGHWWTQFYREGVSVSEVVQERSIDEGESGGFIITFKPDFSVLEPNTFSFAKLAQRGRELAYLVKGLSVTVRDERANPAVEETYLSADGLIDLVRYLSEGKNALHEPVYGNCEVMLYRNDKTPYTTAVDFAFQYTDDMECVERSYVNTVETPEGGSHVLALRSAITNVINERMYYRFEKNELEFFPIEVTRGLVFAISVLHPMPSFESPTKVRLLVPAELYGAVSQAVFKTFQTFMEDRHVSNAISEKCQENRAALRRRSQTGGIEPLLL
jgi:DNA gyrase subunit B